MSALVYRKSSDPCSDAETELRSSIVAPYEDAIEELDSFLCPQEFRLELHVTSSEDSMSDKDLPSDDIDSDIVTSDPALMYEPVVENPRPLPTGPVPPHVAKFTVFMEEGKPWRRVAQS